MNSEKTSGTSLKLKKPTEYANPAKALIMQTGNFFVNYHGFCLFVTKRMTYLPWKRTIECGMLPPTQEYGRLRKLECEEFTLSLEQETHVWQIVQQLQKNPLYMLTRSQLFSVRYEKKKREKEREKEKMKKHAHNTPVQPLRSKHRILHSFQQLKKYG